MTLKLWKRASLGIVLPSLIAAAVVLYAVYNLDAISRQVTVTEAADDVNLTLLELRRYEKNIFLFKEDENTTKFRNYLRDVRQGIVQNQQELISRMGREQYVSLLEHIEIYKRNAEMLVAAIQEERKLEKDIRPLGRVLEKNTRDRELVLDLRRHEKNFIIYREMRAADAVERIASELVQAQPLLGGPVSRYLRAFDRLLEIESVKERLMEQLRLSARAAERITQEFLARERTAIASTIAGSRRMFIAAFVFLVLSIFSAVILFSSHIVGALQKIEGAFEKLDAGDFNHTIPIDPNHAPQEIASLVKAYNRTVSDLGESRKELERSLRKLGEVNRELTERQDEIVEVRKLAAMRLLASEIAHEVNNPLSTISLFLGMYAEDDRLDAGTREHIALMVKEVRRCQSIVSELVDFAKKEALALKETGLAGLVTESLEIVKRMNGKKDVAVAATLDGLPRTVVVDPILMHQALVNILANAYQFTPPGGRISVSGRTEGDAAILTVRDTGPGIAYENLPYIFEPFFSTRRESGGNGLGLALTKKIIERHAGGISVMSRPGEGAVFEVRLPVDGGGEGRR